MYSWWYCLFVFQKKLKWINKSPCFYHRVVLFVFIILLELQLLSAVVLYSFICSTRCMINKPMKFFISDLYVITACVLSLFIDGVRNVLFVLSYNLGWSFTIFTSLNSDLRCRCSSRRPTLAFWCNVLFKVFGLVQNSQTLFDCADCIKLHFIYLSSQ